MKQGTKNWDNAVQELNEMLKANSDFCATVLAVGTAQEIDYRYYLDDETKDRFSANNIREVYNMGVVGVPGDSEDPEGYDSDVDINHFIETREKAIDELQKGVEEILEPGMVRGFGDIVKLGPRNRAEETLLNSAKIFLTPEEFEQSVKENSNANDVLTKIDKGVTMEVTKRILEEARKEVVAEQQQEEAKPKETAMLADVTEITGVTEKLQEMLRETPVVDDAKEIAPPEPHKADGHEAPKGPDMDFFKRKN